jgi:hypothetical protein
MKISITRSLCPLGFLVLAVTLAACDSLIVSRYSLVLPDLPPAWASVQGPPHWRIDWQNPQGRGETLYIRPGEKPEISLPYTWTNAVLAWPYWPEKGIDPEVFMPAGGLFPFDAAGGSFLLSWRGGVDAVLYLELGSVSADNSSSVPRMPWYFNWPRFRELFTDSAVNAEFRADPWLADWPAIAEKIRLSGFDKRRLLPQTRVELTIPLGGVPSGGPWISASPFAKPLYFEAAPAFPVKAAAPSSADIWVCAEGILRCNHETWIFIEF